MAEITETFVSQPYRIAERLVQLCKMVTNLNGDKVRIQKTLIVPDVGEEIFISWGDFETDSLSGIYSSDQSFMNETFQVAIVVNDRENVSTKTAAIRKIAELRAVIQDRLLANQAHEFRQTLKDIDGITIRNLTLSGGTQIKEEIEKGEKIIGQTLMFRMEYIEDWNLEAREITFAKYASETETSEGTTREDEWQATS